MLAKHLENKKDLETIIDVAVNIGYLIATKSIEIEDSRNLIDFVIEITESFEEKFKDFDWNDQPVEPADNSFKDYVIEVDKFSEEELLKRYMPRPTTVSERSLFLKEITKDEAVLLFAAGDGVYELYDDGTEGLIQSREHFDKAEVYGVSK